jgi:hypothetical protein
MQGSEFKLQYHQNKRGCQSHCGRLGGNQVWVTSLLFLPAFHTRLAGPPPAQLFSHMSVKQAVSCGYSGLPVQSVLTALLYLPHSPRYLNPQAHFSSLL